LLIPAVHHEPFQPWQRVDLPAGLSLLDMAKAMELPREWWEHGGYIDINGKPVTDRKLWPMIKPKPGTVTQVRFLYPIHGGGGGDEGGKNPLAVGASLLLLAGTGFIAGGGLFTTFGFSKALFGAGAIGANLAAAAFSGIGSAAIGAAFAPAAPSQASNADANASLGVAEIQGNAISPGAPIKRVAGVRKVFPQARQPLRYFENGGQDEVAETVYYLAGPHEISDIRFGNISVDSLRGVEIETREGWPGQPRIDLVRRYGTTRDIGQEIATHKLQENGRTVEDTAQFGWTPEWLAIATEKEPDEVWLPYAFTQGLHVNGGTATRLRVPFRIRIRRAGTETWQNLPEIHYVGTSLRPKRGMITLKWADSPSVQVSAPSQEGWLNALVDVPAQTLEPAGGAWQADSTFDKGSGETWLDANNYNDTAVKNVELTETDATFWLDTATFPKDYYEIEIQRGIAVKFGTFEIATYETSGTVRNLFGAAGEGKLRVAESQKDRITAVGIMRASSVWNRHPAPTDKLALIAVRARNVQLGEMSCVAKGYVPDWDGIAWRNWTTTTNPAPHFRYALAGGLNPDPVPAEIIDDDDLVAWRADCEALDYQVNAVIEGGTVAQVLERLALAGFARTRMSNEWGVVRGRHTAGEAPRMLFTPRNSRDLQFRKDYPEDLSGLRITYPDSARDYRPEELIWPPNADENKLRAVEYPDLVTEAEVIRQAKFDLTERTARAMDVTFVANIAALTIRRGDLIEVQSDTIYSDVGYGRVVDWTVNGSGEVTHIRLDATVPLVNGDDLADVPDLSAVDDLTQLGQRSCFILRDGAAQRTTGRLANATGETDTLELAEPALIPNLGRGDMLAVGPGGRQSRRLIVAEIGRPSKYEAQILCKPEAPELFSELVTWRGDPMTYQGAALYYGGAA